MAVKVRLFGLVRLRSGIKELDFPAPEEGITVAELVQGLSSRTGLEELASLARQDGSHGHPFIILVDGKNWLELDGPDTVVKDGQVVAVFPPSAGG